jgi:hypothetical protein
MAPKIKTAKRWLKRIAGVLMESKTWPTVGGVIVRSEIEAHDSTASSDGSKKSEAVQYSKIAYQYQVGGQSHKNSRISFSSSSGNANQIVARYPKGKSVQVYYNPDKPKQAVLIPGGDGFNIVPYIFSTVFVVLGIFSATRLRK